MRRIVSVVVASALMLGCDDRLLSEPQVATRRDVSVVVSEPEVGQLAIWIQNHRSERISKPHTKLSLFMVDGAPTIEVAPVKLYHLFEHEEPCVVTPDGIDPGGDWLFQGSIPLHQDPGPDYGDAIEDMRYIHHGAPTAFNLVRLRVWVFPHIGLAHNCVHRSFQFLPHLTIGPTYAESEYLDLWLTGHEFERFFAPSDERGVFEQTPLSASQQSILYYIETDLKLARPMQVYLLADSPTREPFRAKVQ